MENETFEEIAPIEIVKQIRVNIDANIQAVEALTQDENFKQAIRELALVRTKLQEAKMWAGQTLGKMGQELPAEFRDEYESELVHDELEEK